MFFDALTMACVADELRTTLLGGRVQQVLLPDKLAVGIEIYAHRQRRYLLASAHTKLGRLTLASKKLRRGVEKQTGLLLLLRKYVRGAILSAIEQPPFERILHLKFDHVEWGCTELIIEVMGRHSNIILVDPGHHVMDAVKRVTPEMSRVRPILPNQPYSPPPPQDKLPPSELTEYRLRQILASAQEKTPVWRALVRGLQGMSPLLAREIAFRALGQPQAQVTQVERITPLLTTIGELLSPLDDGQWQPTVVLEDDQPAVYGPYPVTHRGEPQPVPSISQAIEAYTAAVATASPYAAAKRSVQGALTDARARLQRRRDALERALPQSGKADRWRQWGEWILAYAHTVTPGQTELVADTGTGESLHIPLDPAKSAVDNAQDCFARYRKVQRAAEEIPVELKKVDLALSDLEQLETDLALATNRPEIDAVRSTLSERGYIQAKKDKRPRPAHSTPLSLTSPDGFRILVGRNSRQNDEVTFQRAQRHDWWFHVRGAPGAHVIVRAGGQELPPDTIRRAAELAAFFSQLQDEIDVLVDYTERRHVRRIPGAAPGLVTYEQEETIRVAPRGPDQSHQQRDAGRFTEGDS
ncbi:MAG: NFACT RNA binding domain-containing protein [Anaerolineae bacterium]|jgi:predicted ribosome quality control (RQC) complex YloA/Tae2 family protein